MTTQRPHPTLETQSRYAVIGPLADGRRVLDIGGDANAVLALAEAGAAELTIASGDADAVRAELEEAEVEGVEVVPLPALPLRFEDEAFDLIIYFDLGSALVADDAWRAELRRVLASDGYLVMALPRPDGQAFGAIAGQRFEPPLTYEEAYERLAETFGNLTLLGQTAIAANLFYDFGSEEEDPDPLLDRSFLPDDEEVGWYVLIFGPEDVRSDDLTVVQVPFGDVVALTAGGAQPAVAGNEDVEALERELRVLREQNAALEERVAAAGSAADPEQAARLDEAEKLAGEARQRLAELEQEAAEGHQRAEELAEEREQLAGRITALETEMAEQREKLTARAAELQEELDAARAALEAIRPTGEETALLAAAEKTIAAQEEKLRDAVERAAQAEEALAAVRAEEERVGASASEVEELRQRVEKLTSELDEAQWTNTETTHAMATLRDQNAKLEAARDDLADKGEAATEELRALREQVTRLEQGRDELAAQVETLQAQSEALQAQSEALRAQSEAQRSEVQSEAERRIETARAEATTAAEQRAAAAEAQLEQLRGSEAGFRTRIENLEVELDVSRDTYDKAVTRFEEQLAEQKTKLDERAASESEAVARVAQLETEAARQIRDRQSFEAQIKDLLEEVTQLRESEEALRGELNRAKQQMGEQEEGARATGGLESELEQRRGEAEQTRRDLDEVRAELDQVRHALERRTQELTDARNEIGRELGEARLNAESQSNAARQEKVRAEKLLEELALAKKKLANVEAENANLAAEAQRLTDALHAQTVGPDAAHHDEDDYVPDETGVAETTLSPEAASPAGEGMKAPAAAQVRRDSVGRPVENALEDIEDLIASSVPPSPTRR